MLFFCVLGNIFLSKEYHFPRLKKKNRLFILYWYYG